MNAPIAPGAAADPARAPRAFLGLSHSPLIGLNPVAPEVGSALQAAITTTSSSPASSTPDSAKINCTSSDTDTLASARHRRHSASAVPSKWPLK